MDEIPFDLQNEVEDLMYPNNDSYRDQSLEYYHQLGNDPNLSLHNQALNISMIRKQPNKVRAFMHDKDISQIIDMSIEMAKPDHYDNHN